ncbi:MAG TPA: glycosyltransferase 87 family protein [Geodermatophilus sp.]|nr:glycosyltransferase 87 family protein [Geodermatophilus sp.]
MSTTPTGPTEPANQPAVGPSASPGAVPGRPIGWPDRVVPTWSDPVAAQASEAVGGPWGRHAVIGRALFWTPLRVCLMFTTAVLALAWIKQAPCADGNWTGFVQYTHLCYSDTVPLFSLHGLDRGALPYLESAVEYPVLTGVFMAVAAALARGYEAFAAAVGLLPEVPAVQAYYVVTCLLLSLCALLVTRAVLGCSGRRPWDAAMVGLSPLLFVHAFTNWDLFAVALAGLGLWAWARRRPLLAGVLIGLGIAAKFYPLLLLGVLFLLCLRAGQLRSWLRTAVGAGVAWLAVNVPVAVLAPEHWSRFFGLNSSRPADPDTLWNIVITLSDGRWLDGPLAGGATPVVLNAVVAGSLLALAAAVAWLTLAAPVRPRVAQVAFLLLAGFLLLNKVWSPQYSLWLLPLAVLARPTWRALLLWQAAEALLWVPRMLWYLGTDNRGVEIEWFFLAVTVRDAAVLVLMGLVVRDIWRPDGDVVRTSWPGVDDPAGGPLDGASDHVTLHRRRTTSGGEWGPEGSARSDEGAPLGGGTAPGRGGRDEWGPEGSARSDEGAPLGGGTAPGRGVVR